MSVYERPSIDEPVCRDPDGQIIDYGNRWDNSPPEDTYSVETHPERFAPLHTIANALVKHLRDNYDVDVVEGIETVADLLHSPYQDVIRGVRIRPNDPTCASLTLVFTGYPGIWMHAGLLHDFVYPVCGCDACDSHWQAEADELEHVVLAVVSGNYRESIGPGPRPWVEYACAYPDGEASGRSYSQDLPARRLKAAKPILRGLPNGWAAWPRSTSGTQST